MIPFTQLSKKTLTLLFGTVYLLLLGIILLTYGDVSDHQFLNWDDAQYIVYNSHIHQLDFTTLKWIFTTHYMENWHPLTWLVYAINYEIFDTNIVGYKYVNMVLHSINSFLVLLLFLQIIQLVYPHHKPSFISYISACLLAIAFAIHPQHVESVIWIAETKDVLCAFFYLLTILYYIRAKQRQNENMLILLFLFFCALMSKAMAVTLPVVLILIDIYLLNKLTLKKENFWKNNHHILTDKWLLFGLSFAVSVITIWVQVNYAAHTVFYNDLINAVSGVIHYIWIIIYPAKIAPFYPYIYSNDIAVWKIILLGGGIIFLTLWSIFSLTSRWRFFACAWLVYLCMLSPVIGVGIKVGGHAYADRYAYLPTISFYLILGWIIYTLLLQVKNYYRVFWVGCLLFIIFNWASITAQYVPVWKNPLTLWSFVQSKHNTSLYTVDKMLAYYYSLNEKKPLYAIALWKKLLTAKPFVLEPYYRITEMYHQLGDKKNMIYYYELAARNNPDSLQTVLNAAIVCYQNKHYKDALYYFQQALKLDKESVAIKKYITLIQGELKHKKIDQTNG